MMRIKLTRGQWATVDAKDFIWLSQFAWRVNSSREYYYYAARNPSPGKMVMMHTEIMGKLAGHFVDHKNQDTLDNRRSNLRFATRAQNRHNSKPRIDKKWSCYKGVGFDPKKRLFRVYLGLGTRKLYVGRFKNETAAACAYDTAATKHFGKFARLNFPKNNKPKTN